MVFDSDPNGNELLNAHLRQMMDQLSRLGAGEEEGNWSPPVDIYETPDAVILVAEVAGVSRQEVRVVVDGSTVRLYGHRHPTCCDTGARYHRLEIASGAFVRSFRITVPFVAERVSARSEEGLLYVTLPKAR
jgi:HSP20 family protein